MAKTGYCSIVQVGQNAAERTSDITVKGIITTTGESYRGDHRTGTYSIYQGGVLIKSGTFTNGAPANATTELFSVTVKVTHNADGTSDVITASYNYDSGWCVGNGSLSLAPLAVHSTFSLSADTAEFGEYINLTFEKCNDNCIHRLYYMINGGEQVFYTSDIDVMLAWYIDPELMRKIPNSIKATVTLRLYTLINDSVVGWHDESFLAVVPEDIYPTCEISIRDSTTNFDRFGSYVQGKSKLRVEIIPYPQYGASIVSTTTYIDGSTYTNTGIDTSEILSSGTIFIEVKLTDTRGRSFATIRDITVLPYKPPVISALRAERCKEDGTIYDQGDFVKLTFSAEVSALNDKNTSVYAVEIKKSKDTSYDSAEIENLENEFVVNAHSVVFAADSDNTYDINLVVTDTFGPPVRKPIVVSSGYTILHFNKSGKGVAIGKVSEFDGFEVAMKTRFYDDNDNPHDVANELAEMAKFVGTEIAKAEIIYVERKDDSGGKLTTIFNEDNKWKAIYTDADGNEISRSEFDFINKQFHLDGTIDNKEICRVSVDGAKVFEAGHADGNTDAPYLSFGGPLIKRFADGLWIGNYAPKDDFGVFVPKEGYSGLFICETDKRTYVVNGTSKEHIYTGDAIARFA